MSTSGCSVRQGDIISTLGDVQYIWGIPLVHWGMLSTPGFSI